jgi:hypothetical protein
VSQVTRYLTRDRAAILLPWRASWPNTNVALLLVVVVVAVAAIGNRTAGALAAVGGGGLVRLFLHRAL